MSKGLGRLASSSGTATFSSAVMLAIRWKDWKTMPMLRPRKSATRSSLKACNGVPLMLISPLSSFSSPASTISNVDFPEPDGPTMPTDSPAAIVRSMPFSTWTEAAALPSVKSARFKLDDGFCQQYSPYIDADRSCQSRESGMSFKVAGLHIAVIVASLISCDRGIAQNDQPGRLRRQPDGGLPTSSRRWLSGKAASSTESQGSRHIRSPMRACPATPRLAVLRGSTGRFLTAPMA